jgi:hypothetical protein
MKRPLISNLVPRWIMVELYLQSPICLHGFMDNFTYTLVTTVYYWRLVTQKAVNSLGQLQSWHEVILPLEPTATVWETHLNSYCHFFPWSINTAFFPFKQVNYECFCMSLLANSYWQTGCGCCGLLDNCKQICTWQLYSMLGCLTGGPDHLEV